ncbi:protein ImuA [Limimonas halophila]|uniref:Protein ImuA n=1 Tax=Limimonas halophila TaxID=1082479 RepID=A0A1G7QKC6_9PROT|nr:hypothetical protein [Limimonas halophila]SDF98956.1 protein ImuA [Limimonas halophila]
MADLDHLRARIRALERGNAPDAGVLPLGAEALDTALPGGGLARAAVHEVVPARTGWDDGPAAGFALALAGRALARADGPVLWVARTLDLYPPGIAGYGVPPARLLCARAPDDAGVLWTLEEALRCPALAAAVGEVGHLGRTSVRRLQLAAEAGGVTGLLLQRRRIPPTRAEPSAAVTRWRVGALPRISLTSGPRWRVELARVRGGLPTEFEVIWDDATGRFALAAPLRDRAAAG